MAHAPEVGDEDEGDGIEEDERRDAFRNKCNQMTRIVLGEFDVKFWKNRVCFFLNKVYLIIVKKCSESIPFDAVADQLVVQPKK